VTVQRVLAQATVRDLGVAEQWYTTVFDGPPDTRPMAGLIEWHLGEAFGVQVWAEPERAGRSSMVLDETDLDALANRLSRAGVEHAELEQATSARILRLSDPDGNRIVFTQA
jgi:hypothetical protein